MIGESLAAWILAPALAVVAALGLGLLVERLGGRRLPALRVPVGICAAVCLSLLVYEVGGTGIVAVLVIGVAALAGLVLERSQLPLIRPGWLALAGVAAFGLHMAPVVLSGGWTWAGYNFVNDTSIQMLLAQHLADHATAAPDVSLPTTAAQHLKVYLQNDYPLGSHALLATLSQAVPAPLEALYQPLIAIFAAVCATSLAWLGKRMGMPAPVAAAAGVLAVGANLFYQYALQGNMKEVAFLAAFASAAAVGRELIEDREPLRVAPAAAICFGAAFCVYSVAAAPYLALLGAGLAGGALLLSERATIARLAGAGAALLGLSLLFALPSVLAIVRFNEVASAAFSSTSRAADLGQLLRPLELIQAAGIWLFGDYRAPIPGSLAGVTTALCVVVLALLAVGALNALRAREPAGLLLLAATVISAAYLLPRLTPYADGKVLALASPVFVLMAAAGAWTLWGVWRPLGAVLGAAVALGVVWSDGLAYHAVKLAPIGRLEAIADAGRHARGAPGLVLFNEPEEFAKNYTGGAAYNDPTEPVTGQFVVLRTPQDFTSRYFDLDEEALPFVEGYNTIVMRRSPDASRPPANYRLTYVNEWYEVWRKQPGEQVVDHLPLQKPHVAALRPDCAAVTALARKARPGDELVAARRPATLVLDTARAKRSAGWVDHPYMPDMVITVTPGKAAETVRAAEGGRYRAWLAGSFSRPIESRIDGRDIGAVAQVNNLGQWLPVRTVTVSPGRHRLEIERGGGGLGPGDGYSGELGPLVLEAAKPIELRRFPPDRARSLCSSPWDWVEVVRPR